ncbi:MAG TPA: GNAT family N-acetyltransferase [Solirubrobacteraceae bacterium]|nr:GNAT family N-acetyltransferase [Solirubrobacteraceae bacterium]
MWFPGALAVARRWGGPAWAAWRNERLIAVAVCFDPGRVAPQGRRQLYEASFWLAGPGPYSRGLRLQQVMDEHRPPGPHVYLWLLGTAPDAQRTGAASALLAEVAAHADAQQLPTYLETMNPRNVPFYCGRGFQVRGQAAMPRGARAWFMQRPPG